MNRNELYEALCAEGIVNVHCHHLRDQFQTGMSLKYLFEHSYVNLCTKDIPDGKDRAEVDAFLRIVRHRSYFICLENALREIFGIREHLCYENWAAFDEALAAAYADPEYHLKLLREKCRYEAVILDAYWEPGSDNAHPDLFHPAYRIDGFLDGYNHTINDYEGNNFQCRAGVDIRDIDEYTSRMDEVLRAAKAGSSPIMKCAMAYNRSLAFDRPDKLAAQRAMCDEPDPADVIAFQDYIFRHLCRLSAELDMPLQIHTGLGKMENSRALALQPSIKANPDTKFILMHGSYPWTDDIAGLAHNYGNVYIDLCWLPLISVSVAQRFLHEILDTCNADRIMWGCDTHIGEESYGAKTAFIRVLAQTLSERAECGYIDESEVIPTARMILSSNAGRML